MQKTRNKKVNTILIATILIALTGIASYCYISSQNNQVQPKTTSLSPTPTTTENLCNNEFNTGEWLEYTDKNKLFTFCRPPYSKISEIKGRDLHGDAVASISIISGKVSGEPSAFHLTVVRGNMESHTNEDRLGYALIKNRFKYLEAEEIEIVNVTAKSWSWPENVNRGDTAYRDIILERNGYTYYFAVSHNTDVLDYVLTNFKFLD